MNCSENDIMVENVLLAPDADHIAKCAILPNAEHGSDHFPLCANFAIAKKTEKLPLNII